MAAIVGGGVMRSGGRGLPVGRLLAATAAAGASSVASSSTSMSTWRTSAPRRPPSSWALGQQQQRQVLASRHSTRSFATTANPSTSTNDTDVDTVQLAFDRTDPPAAKIDPKARDQGQCLVICHGLYGSKQNWRSLSRTFASRLGYPIYTLDLRNHGTSPHARPHTYEAMARDLERFMKEQQLGEDGAATVNLMGHSMGGKVVMAYALNPSFSPRLRSLISNDMAPWIGKISPEFRQYAQGMKEVEEAKVGSKKEADAILQKYEKALPTRQFLLTNSELDKRTGFIRFRIPLDILSEHIPDIGDFPHAFDPNNNGASSSKAEARWDGPTLFIKGEHSKYINTRNWTACQSLFPNARLEKLDTGHWTHAEKPQEYVEMVERFVKGVGK